MAGGQERILRRRIRSIKSTQKITKAMELIAASQIVRAQGRIAASSKHFALGRNVPGVRQGLAGTQPPGDADRNIVDGQHGLRFSLKPQLRQPNFPTGKPDPDAREAPARPGLQAQNMRHA